MLGKKNQASWKRLLQHRLRITSPIGAEMLSVALPGTAVLPRLIYTRLRRRISR
jgi:hypothetical protein